MNEDGAVRDAHGQFVPGHPHRFRPGQSGNPHGRPKGASFANALARQAAAPVSDREEMARIAQTIGLDPKEARNIDVVAGLYYVVLCRMLVRASTANGRADERLVGMLQVLSRALDPAELRVSGPDGGPIPIAAVIANVQTALGMRPVDAPQVTLDLPDQKQWSDQWLESWRHEARIEWAAVRSKRRAQSGAARNLNS